jgi:hypothetical protein
MLWTNLIFRIDFFSNHDLLAGFLGCKTNVVWFLIRNNINIARRKTLQGRMIRETKDRRMDQRASY